MSVPNLTNNLIQQQNIVINQVPIQHAIMTNVNAHNAMPITTALTSAQTASTTTTDQQSNVVETTPISVVNNSNNNNSNNNSNLSNIQTTTTAIKSSIPTTITTTTTGGSGASSTANTTETGQVLTKQRLQDLVRDTDSTLNLEDEVEEIILNYVDEFVERCLNGAALIAKNRHVNTIEVKDVQQFLNRNYNMWTPGFGTDELRPYKRSLTTEAHKQRLALIRKTLKKY